MSNDRSNYFCSPPGTSSRVNSGNGTNTGISDFGPFLQMGQFHDLVIDSIALYMRYHVFDLYAKLCL